MASIDTASGAGVQLGFGTDLGETHDQSREFVLRAKVQGAADVIRSATTVNAALLGHADLLVVDGDPLADVEVLAGQGERLDLIVRDVEIVVNRLG